MRYEDHLKKTEELRAEIARLKKVPDQEDVICYLLGVADGLVTAARLLTEMRLSSKTEGKA